MSAAANKKAFGFEGYSSPNNLEQITDPFSPTKFPKLTIPRIKKESFFTEAIRKKSYMVCGPNSYSKLSEWDKALPARAGMFKKNERRTIPGEIEHLHKKPEKCTPGVGKYNPEAWRAEKVTKVKGFAKINAERITAID